MCDYNLFLYGRSVISSRQKLRKTAKEIHYYKFNGRYLKYVLIYTTIIYYF